MLSKILDYLSKALGFATNITDPKQYSIKEEKKYKYRLEAAMKYINADRRVGEFEKYDDKHIEKFKVHYAKRVFDAS